MNLIMPVLPVEGLVSRRKGESSHFDRNCKSGTEETPLIVSTFLLEGPLTPPLSPLPTPVLPRKDRGPPTDFPYLRRNL